MNHQIYKSRGLERSESLGLFAQEIQSRFNRFPETVSAFKARRGKKLTLIVNAAHQLAKVREMEKRANLYFTPKEYLPPYDVDRSSKLLILHLSEQYQDFNLDAKPALDTKEQVLSFIDVVTSIKPALEPFLAAPRIKIAAFKNDTSVVTYFNAAKTPKALATHQQSYAEFLKWQFSKNRHCTHWSKSTDYSTTLTPNEVLGMPSVEDLVGLVIDPSRSNSFDQALATLTHLKNAGVSDWADVANKAPPFAHLLSHMDEGTLIQLGWSKMIVPYSTRGLKQFCTTGKVDAIDGVKFTPDYFVLLHRIASSGILVFSAGYVSVDLLYQKGNVIGNFNSIETSPGENLFCSAIKLQDIHPDTLRLFFHLARIGEGQFRGIKYALNRTSATPKNRELLEKLLSLNDRALVDDLHQLLRSNINRIERANAASAKCPRKVKYRCGIQDEGLFTYNSLLGSLALTEGVRIYDEKKRMVGFFKHSNKMQQGGSSPAVGVLTAEKFCRFGEMLSYFSTLSIQEMTSAKNVTFFRLDVYDQCVLLNIDFSVQQSARTHFRLHDVNTKDEVKFSLDNPDRQQDLQEVLTNPAIALRYLAVGLRSVGSLPPDKLPVALVSLVILKNTVSAQSSLINRHLVSINTDRSRLSKDLLELIHALEDLLHVCKHAINTLVRLHKSTHANRPELELRLGPFKQSTLTHVVSHLFKEYGLQVLLINVKDLVPDFVLQARRRPHAQATSSHAASQATPTVVAPAIVPAIVPATAPAIAPIHVPNPPSTAPVKKAPSDGLIAGLKFGLKQLFKKS
ncbi:MAG TPA: hypothetical protein VFV39_01625 [Limnobacter sp.]|nr:hypothetical protein [Limnobacter sp.]